MAASGRRAATGDRAEQELRIQEVIRANKELASYFKGRRTEREARAALKIIKAFIRDRERTNPADRWPLPGTETSIEPAARMRRKPSAKPLSVSPAERASRAAADE